MILIRIYSIENKTVDAVEYDIWMILLYVKYNHNKLLS